MRKRNVRNKVKTTVLAVGVQETRAGTPFCILTEKILLKANIVFLIILPKHIRVEEKSSNVVREGPASPLVNFLH